MAILKTNIGALQLKNPVMTASGTFGYGIEFEDLVDLTRIGGIIVKGTTFNPRQGNDYPRMAETASGMMNCVGLQNKGVRYFCETIYPKIRRIDTEMSSTYPAPTYTTEAWLLASAPKALRVWSRLSARLTPRR